MIGWDRLFLLAYDARAGGGKEALMRFHDSEEYRRTERLQLLHTGPRLSRQEGREIFREMVRAETRNGPLSPTRRKRLIQYAAALQLTPMDASRIVSEVTREQSQDDALTPPLLYRAVEAVAEPNRWPLWLRISSVVGAGFAIQRMLVVLLAG